MIIFDLSLNTTVMTSAQASLIRQAAEKCTVYTDEKKYTPTVLLAQGDFYVAYNHSALVVQMVTNGFFCVGEADVYTAFPKAWLIDRNAFERIGKFSSPARVVVIDTL